MRKLIQSAILVLEKDGPVPVLAGANADAGSYVFIRMFMEPGVPEEYINLYGAERMAYGTDYPMSDPVNEVKCFLQLNLTDEQKEQIAHKTAERILKL